MDSFEWNKIAGAVLFAILLSVGLSIFSGVIFHTEAPETPGYVIAVATEEGAAPAEAQPFPVLLAAADPKASPPDPVYVKSAQARPLVAKGVDVLIPGGGIPMLLFAPL